MALEPGLRLGAKELRLLAQAVADTYESVDSRGLPDVVMEDLLQPMRAALVEIYEARPSAQRLIFEKVNDAVTRSAFYRVENGHLVPVTAISVADLALVIQGGLAASGDAVDWELAREPNQSDSAILGMGGPA